MRHLIFLFLDKKTRYSIILHQRKQERERGREGERTQQRERERGGEGWWRSSVAGRTKPAVIGIPIPRKHRRALKEAQRSQANNGVLKCSLEVILAITTFRFQTRQKIALSAQIVLSITSVFLCLCLRLRGTLFPHFSVRSPSSHFLASCLVPKKKKRKKKKIETFEVVTCEPNNNTQKSFHFCSFN